MAVGFGTEKATIDAVAGHVAVTIRDTLDQAARVKAWLDSKPDEDLEALGYTPAEVAILKSAFTDLDNLRKVARGQQSQQEANDFLFWAAKLTGLN